ncbi:cytochrome c3 family protein [Fulvivirgaceae bacterium BMA10]|uniref:Cytochrome c3 family protein n=1 Tax=Splendidivirga corallicola TaxID=3051826 RepID=A0ABT8KRP6_9BACT|nr:cytochrome c3 family protein [Fulvivirgaceae bacterium BMA10]
MKNCYTNFLSAICLFIVPLMLFEACSGSHEEGAGHESLLETIKRKEKDSIENDVNLHELMRDVKKVLAEVPESERQFYVLERKSELKSFPCTNCHNVPLSSLQSDFAKQQKKKAHWEIELVHANKDIMDCNTCHDQNDLNSLVLLNGKKVDFDQSFKQCAQCHSTQYNDWLGGAHGKRVLGWADPKVIYNCVNCHVPHEPALPTRWPARLNTAKLKERQSDEN